MNDLNGAFAKIIGAGVLLLLLAILALVTYSVLKPPIVNRETIDALVKSASSTEAYVKELRELAYQNKLDTEKDNKLLRETGIQREGDYKDLYNKYGIVSHEDFYASNIVVPDFSVIGGLRIKNNGDRREQLHTHPE